MKIIRLTIQNFRGLREATIRPAGHVVIGGEPRAGRTTVVEALRRVLTPDATRLPLADDLDFYRLNRANSIEIEVVLGDLGDELEQEFFDTLEPWDDETGEVITQAPDPTVIDETDMVVRLCYRAQWNDETEVADHWVDFPKASNPASGHYARLSRRQLRALPVVVVDPSTRPLALSARAEFRRLVEQAAGDDFSVAVENLVEQIEVGADAFSSTEQVSAALDTVLWPVRQPLGLGHTPSERAVAFLPEGGSMSGVLRSLGASLTLQGVSLPLSRHGSTAVETLRSGEALAVSGDREAVVVIDDFGEGLDLATATHLAATLRATANQVWMTTRRGSVAEAFSTEELVRVTRRRIGTRERVYQGRRPRSRAERTASRHLALQLLPAIASRTLVVLEGPHDRAGLNAVAARRHGLTGEPLPAADGIHLSDAAAVDRSGGASAAAKLATYAATLGFRIIVVLDGDKAGDDAEAEAAAAAHAVIRLPAGAAIERALVDGVSEGHIRVALARLEKAYGMALPAATPAADENELRKIATAFIKQGGGLHAQFVELLPLKTVPPLAAKVLDAIRDVNRRNGRRIVRL